MLNIVDDTFHIIVKNNDVVDKSRFVHVEDGSADYRIGIKQIIKRIYDNNGPVWITCKGLTRLVKVWFHNKHEGNIIEEYSLVHVCFDQPDGRLVNVWNFTGETSCDQDILYRVIYEMIKLKSIIIYQKDYESHMQEVFKSIVVLNDIDTEHFK